MKSFAKTLLAIVGVLALNIPVAMVLTFLLLPFWNWVETRYQFESVGHSGPAEWCFLAVYLVLAVIGATTLLVLSGRRSRVTHQ